MRILQVSKQNVLYVHHYVNFKFGNRKTVKTLK